MTPRDYAAMTDAELAQDAAVRMWGQPDFKNSVYAYWELTPKDYKSRRVVAVQGDYSGRESRQFKPAADLNHAAELAAAFLVRWRGTAINIRRVLVLWEVAIVTPWPDGGDVRLLARECYASEARARTVATLTAWDALEGAG